MAELKAQIKKSADKLREAWALVQVTSNTQLPTKCYEHWAKKASLYSALAGTVEILPARENAWEIVQKVASSIRINEGKPNAIKYGDLEIDFALARHLALTSYMVMTWSAYDRLANVCGRLAAITSLSENPKQNPKIFEDFLGKKDIFSFGAHFHLQQAYAWPITVSYQVRNWLVHEGFERGDIAMFVGDRIADSFFLHEDAAEYFKRYCKENEKMEACCLEETEDPWQTMNLLEILPKYHTEMDAMFVGLVQWSVDSFISQITAFSERDKPRLIRSE